MPEPESEVAVDDSAAPGSTSPEVTSDRAVEVVVYVVLLALAVVLGYDNWRSGMGWAKDGPQSGYLPFYLCVILAGASLFGLGAVLARRSQSSQTSRRQLARESPGC